jgi:hypothetical protein
MEEYFIEVLNSNGVWYQAFLVDFNSNEVLVKFDLKAQNVHKYPYNQARLPSNQQQQASSILKVNDECEVLIESKSESEPSGWCPAVVKMVKGEFFVVDFKLDINNDKIFSSDKIRLSNTKYVFLSQFRKLINSIRRLFYHFNSDALQPNFLHKIVFPVPDDLREM